MDILIKVCTGVTTLAVIAAVYSLLKEEGVDKARVVSMFFFLIMIGLPFGRVWGVW